jgi:hypothetical protein
VITISPHGYRLIVRGPGRPRRPFNNSRPWLPQFVALGSASGGKKTLFVNYNLKGGVLWQYVHRPMLTAVADNWLALLKTAPPTFTQPFIKGEFYNLSVPPTVVDKYPLD